MKLPLPPKLSFRRVRAAHPEVRELQAEIERLIEQLDARFAASYFHGMPINVPFPFRAAAFPATFKFDERFVKCDGKRIVDGASPLNGQFAPVITDVLGGAEALTWYLRIKD